MAFRAFLAGVLVLGALAPLHAQAPLTLDEAVARALAGNPDLAAAAAAVDGAGARVDQARAGYLPRVDLVESWQRGDAPLFAFSALLGARQVTPADLDTARLNQPDVGNYFRAGLVVQQTVFDGGQARRAVEAASLGREAAAEALRAARHDLALEVVRAYAAALVSDARAAAARQAIEAATADKARVDARRDAGLATDADVLAIAAHVADVESRAIQAEADADTSRARLNRLMAAPLDQPLVLVEPAPPPPAGAVDLATETRAAEAARPETRAARLQASIAAATRSAAAAPFLPQVAVQAGYEWTGRTFADRPASWVVGAEVRWNLFRGGADRARLAEAAAGVTQAAAREASARAAVAESVFAARRQLDAARARDAVGRAAIAQAREAERVTRERYEAGLASVTDLLRAATATLDSETRAAGARLDLVMTAALVAHAAGDPLFLP
ncbi:MAG: TolC family protein [Vicinamibacterales bacterium]